MASSSQPQVNAHTKDAFGLGDSVVLGRARDVLLSHRGSRATIIEKHICHCTVFVYDHQRRQHVTFPVDYSSIAGIDSARAKTNVLLGNQAQGGYSQRKCDSNVPIVFELAAAVVSHEEQEAAVEQARRNVLTATAAIQEAESFTTRRELGAAAAEEKAVARRTIGCLSGFWRLLRRT